MQILDVEKKGNVIRVYYGSHLLEDWYGDDWNDRGCNDRVYDQFIAGYRDYYIPFEHGVYSPFDFYESEERYCKDMMKSGTVPLFVIREDDDIDRAYNWENACVPVKNKKVYPIFMGDKLEKLDGCELVEQIGGQKIC